MIYGNASRNIMKGNLSIQSFEVLLSSYIMKRVIVKKMRGRENYILNQVMVSAILKLA